MTKQKGEASERGFTQPATFFIKNTLQAIAVLAVVTWGLKSYRIIVSMAAAWSAHKKATLDICERNRTNRKLSSLTGFLDHRVLLCKDNKYLNKSKVRVVWIATNICLPCINAGALQSLYVYNTPRYPFNPSHECHDIRPEGLTY